MGAPASDVSLIDICSGICKKTNFDSIAKQTKEQMTCGKHQACMVGLKMHWADCTLVRRHGRKNRRIIAPQLE